jgi:GNAT superfamily N-acetyltransferase
MLKRLDHVTGGLKRVFVTQNARGRGSGRALIEARESAARSMGLKRLIADTLTPNIELRTLYPKLGFVELDEPIPTTIYNDQPMQWRYLHCFSKAYNKLSR